MQAASMACIQAQGVLDHLFGLLKLTRIGVLQRQVKRIINALRIQLSCFLEMLQALLEQSTTFLSAKLLLRQNGISSADQELCSGLQEVALCVLAGFSCPLNAEVRFCGLL